MKESVEHDNLYKIRHSLAHILAQAVLEIRPDAKLAFGPPVDNGFYYDFALEKPISSDDFADIEQRMKKIIKERQPFEEVVRPADEALAHLESGGEEFKLEYAKELIESGESSLGFFKNGPFEDMCRGPHLEHTGQVPKNCFSLDSIAGAYWRGDEKRPQLTRIYGLAFEDGKALKEYKQMRELAKERDHRKLGSELDIYTLSDEVGPGLVMWLPNGTTIKDALEDYAKEIEFRAGYKRVTTPHITKEGLYYKSGHLPYYEDTMYPPMELEGESKYYLKPMNCPHHHMIFASRQRSYRDLPYRLAEYGVCYRYEDSGALSGLLRVRMLSMNDAHIYLRPEQLDNEFKALIEMHRDYYEKFRLSGYKMRLSLHDPERKEKYLDNPEAWKFSEDAIRKVLDDIGADYEAALDEAAFYGPKIDYQIKNVIGREETASTIQLDFAGAERFELKYVAEDGSEKQPYIIHRAPLSTHERFLAFLIEHFGGAFPTWMAPLQVKVIPVNEEVLPYAEKIEKLLLDSFVRVEIDRSAESFNKKIRNAVTKKTPNMLIVGKKEMESDSITWRRYCTKEQRSMKLSEFSSLVSKMISTRTMDCFEDEALPES